MFGRLVWTSVGLLTIGWLGASGCSDSSPAESQTEVMDAGAGADTQTDAAAVSDAAPNPDAASVSDGATEPDARSEPDTGTEPDASTEPDAAARPDASTEPDAGTEADAGIEPDASIEPDANSEPDASTEADAGIEPDAGTDLGSDQASFELVRDMGLGWNLGNTLDSCSSRVSDDVDETFWGNPRATEALFVALRDDGIRSIRIPVTWRHQLGPAPGYSIDGAWMDRVQEVVDYAVDNQMYAIINLHHDGGGDPRGGAWIRNASTDYDATMQEYVAVWSQIAERFQDYPEYLVFESMNEVGFDDLPDSEAYALLNTVNQVFVDLIRASGGKNGTRHLLIAGYWTDIHRSAEGTVMPTDPARRCILSVHYYTPSEFCVTGEVRTWGTQSEIDVLLGDFELLRSSFVDRGYPVILGEYGASSATQTSSRVFWLEHVTKVAYDLGVAPYLWDNGGEFNRLTYTWRTPGLLEALLRATSGEDYTVTRQ